MKRILIIRLSAIGDAVMTSSLLPALRSRWPGAHLAWLAEPQVLDLLRHNPRLDEVIVWPRQRWRRLWRERRFRTLAAEIGAFRRVLRARRYDLVLDAQGLFKSGFLAWLTGAGERIGLGSREGSRIFMTRVIRRESRHPRICSDYLHLVRELGIEPAGFPMDLVPGKSGRAAAESALAELGVEAGYALVCPFTTRPQKHWVESRWVELVNRMREELAMPVLMLGGPGDVRAANRIAMGGNGLHDLAGRTSLDAAMALVEGADLLVGVDTGLTHMGIAFRRPTVALFGSTRPYLDTMTPRAKVLYSGFDCSPCGRRPTCGGAFHCMGHHSVDSVMEACRGVLARRR